MSTAAFSISASPSTDAGYDATAGEVLSLKIEASPGLDLKRTTFSVVQKSPGAPALVFSPVSGSPVLPTGIVTTTMPAGVHAYILRCVINGGLDDSAQVVADWTRERMVVIRTGTGQRKITPAETTQYDATYGWAEAFDNMVGAMGLIGTQWHPAVRAATHAALPANTRVGNVLTASANGALPAQDGVTLVVGDRVLVQLEGGGASHINNGVYTVTSLGSAGTKWVLTRADDMDETAELESGIVIPVEDGTRYAGFHFELLTANPITLNTTALQWEPTVPTQLAKLPAPVNIVRRNAADSGWENLLTTSGDVVSLSAPAAAPNTDPAILLSVSGSPVAWVSAWWLELSGVLRVQQSDAAPTHMPTSGAIQIAGVDPFIAARAAGWGADVELLGYSTAAGTMYTKASGVLLGDGGVWGAASGWCSVEGGTGFRVSEGGSGGTWTFASDTLLTDAPALTWDAATGAEVVISYAARALDHGNDLRIMGQGTVEAAHDGGNIIIHAGRPGAGGVAGAVVLREATGSTDVLRVPSAHNVTIGIDGAAATLTMGQVGAGAAVEYKITTATGDNLHVQGSNVVHICGSGGAYASGNGLLTFGSTTYLGAGGQWSFICSSTRVSSYLVYGTKQGGNNLPLSGDNIVFGVDDAANALAGVTCVLRGAKHSNAGSTASTLKIRAFEGPASAGGPIVFATGADTERLRTDDGGVALTGDLRRKTTTTSANPYALADTDHVVIYKGAGGQANLPAAPATDREVTIVNATAGNITVGRNGKNINGAAADFTLGSYCRFVATYDGTEWWAGRF